MGYKDILKRHGIRLYISDEPLDTKGVYIRGINTVVLSRGLSDAETIAVLSHELKHALDEHELNELNAPSVRLKQERRANEYMADHLINEYLESCATPPTYVDVVWFLKTRHLSNDLYTYVDCTFRDILTS